MQHAVAETEQSRSAAARRIAPLLLGALLLVLAGNLSGLRRGLPCHYSYHPDAVAPLRALGHLLRFADPPRGHTDKYPGFAYLVYAVPSWIVLHARGDAQAGDLLERARELGPDAWREQVSTTFWEDCAPFTDALSDCIVAGRVVAALSSMLAALGAALLAARFFGARAAPLAALGVGLFPYVAYYGHTMNTDAPCLAFTLLGLAAAARALDRPGWFAPLACGVLFALAAATKDQIAALLAFVPPCMALVEWRRRRADPAAPRRITWPRAALCAGAFGVVYAFASGLALAPDAWLRHARFGLSPAIREQYAVTGDPWKLHAFPLIYFARSADLAGVVVMGAGLWHALRRRREYALLLLLPALVFYALFIARNAVPYPRFLMPIFVLLVIAGAGWTVAAVGRSRARLRVVVGTAAIAWIALQGAAVGPLLVREPRYHAARIMADRFPAGIRVLSCSNDALPPPLVPSRCERRWTNSAGYAEEFAAFDPGIVVRAVSRDLTDLWRPLMPDASHVGLVVPRASLPPLTVWGLLDPDVWHPLAYDVDVDAEVVIFHTW